MLSETNHHFLKNNFQEFLPPYIIKADEFKRLGVDEIACISVADPYVMSAWGVHNSAQGRVMIWVI